MEKCLALIEGKINHRRQQENDINGISKGLLVFGIVRARGVEFSSKISLLDFSGDVGAVRIAMMAQQFARPQPSWIKVGEIAARTLVQLGVDFLVGNKDPLHIK